MTVGELKKVLTSTLIRDDMQVYLESQDDPFQIGPATRAYPSWQPATHTKPEHTVFLVTNAE